MTMDLGRVGVWTFQFEAMPWPRVAEAAREIEDLGYGALWIPEAVGREAFTESALLLGATKRIVVATGIANIFARDAVAASAAHKTITEVYPERFLLGLGVSHAHLVEGVRGHVYEKPLQKMAEYLDHMDKALYKTPPPSTEPRRCLAALGPKMLELAARKTMGAHPYFVPVAHTAEARRVLGQGPLLAPEQAFVLETDPSRAREVARNHMGVYLRAPNYVNNLRRLGYTDDDLARGGSDRLVDDLVAWGTEGDVAARVRAHHEAGADHVCLQALAMDPEDFQMAQYRRMAEALLRG